MKGQGLTVPPFFFDAPSNGATQNAPFARKKRGDLTIDGEAARPNLSREGL